MNSKLACASLHKFNVAADTVTASQVVALGEAIVSRDPLALAKFEVYAMSRYSNFNKEREAILLDIQKFGTIYGR